MSQSDPIDQQLRKELIDVLRKHHEYLPDITDGKINAVLRDLVPLYDTYAARRAGLGASEKPAPQEEVGGKQVDTSHPEKED